MLIQPPPNPQKELAALDAYRRAKLGKLYGKFWVAPGVRWPSEFTDDGVWEPLPPKKPAESVRFAHEEERLKKAIGAEFDFHADSNGVTESYGRNSASIPQTAAVNQRKFVRRLPF